MANQQNAIVLFIILTLICFSALTPNFFTFKNLMNIVRQISVTAFVAFGMTFVILIAGIDLTVGSTVCAAAIVAAVVNLSTHSLLMTIAAALTAGTIIGVASGLIIVAIGIPDFIVTLAMMSIVRGIVMVYTKAVPIYGFEQNYFFLGQGYLGPIPFPVVLAVVVFLAGYIVLKFTRFGRHVYAVGGSREVARLAGIDIKRVRVIVYAISGFMAALCGLVLSSRTAAAVPTSGVGYEMDAIASVVLGGTYLFGGKGSILGTLLGLTVLGILSNGLILIGVNPFYVTIVKGVVLLIAISVSKSAAKD